MDTRRDSEVSAELHPFDVRTVQVAEELIDLWDEVPLDSEKIAKVAPTTLLFMPQGMIELLRLIEHASYDRDIAALSAALGFRGKGDRNVAQRLSDFAVEHEREEGRTTRRWAHNGAYKLAELIVRAIDEPPELTITFEQVAEEPVRFAITVEREEPESNINPLLTLEASVYGAALDAMWSRFFSGEELDTEGTLFKGTFDAPELLSLKLAWLCPVTPTVGWSVRSLSRFWLDSHHGPAGGYWQLASEA